MGRSSAELVNVGAAVVPVVAGCSGWGYLDANIYPWPPSGGRSPGDLEAISFDYYAKY
jgi:hypothetical protein